MLTAKNTGSTVVYYKWARCESVKMAGARQDDTVRFFLADMQGSILPGSYKDFTFTFVSHASGTFVEDWEISSLPAVPTTQHKITLRGVSVVDDLDTG